MHSGFSTACCIRKLIACPCAHRQRWLREIGGRVVFVCGGHGCNGSLFTGGCTDRNVCAP
jgi:hypothetical protein